MARPTGQTVVMGDPAADYGVLRGDVAALWLDRDMVRVAGPDAVGFLQGQCSQDVAALAVGGSAWSLVLQPQGKVDALVRATRTAVDAIVLDVDGGFGDLLIGRLARFKLRVKAEMDTLEWRCLALRGPGAAASGATVVDPEVLVADAGWPGLPGVDLLGPAPQAPAGVELIGDAAYQIARIESGIPAMGAELTERTIPAEAGIVERTVSFTKGCYTGQELVARIDSRGGHVPRHLRGIVIDGAAPAGAAVVVAGKTVGALTSVAATPDGTVALAYVGRDVVPPAPALVTWEGGRAAARVEALPIVG
jgi:folate-binding protein YgfZ